MRWTIKDDPNIGDTRVQVKFAWLPTLVQNSDEQDKWYAIWLETYQRIQEYSKYDAWGGQRVINWRTVKRMIFNHDRKKW